jgi:hypothetical protein
MAMFAVTLLALVVWLANPAIGVAKAMEFPVSCVVAGKVEAGLADQVCAEMIAVLAQTHPTITFVESKVVGSPSLTVTIHHATTTATGLQLAWITQKGQRIAGERMSVSAVDTSLTPSRRNSLYRRALAATPLPIE